MFDRIELISMSRAMTDHAAQRQTVVARNIANADTPGYLARDLAPFAASYRAVTAGPLRGTNPRHLTDPFTGAAIARTVADEGEISPNGNSVSLEAEMVKTAELRSEYDLSLGVYRSALDMLRTSIGRRG
ncbi:FlgB family protein [uncultured Paracoccus sp.]|uniref:FlgB family protein n=1 Tax=uncultured Paracoccus sp. TaxID=189685 RepID=UPI002604D2AF|nr:FlgB family protein [uncultured Paracoccus sp.]